MAGRSIRAAPADGRGFAGSGRSSARWRPDGCCRGRRRRLGRCWTATTSAAGCATCSGSCPRPATTRRLTGPRSSAGNDFGDVTCLAEACRASASLPGGFTPVDESSALAKSRVRPAWDAGRTALIDGGVIDNAPFGPVLDETVRRPVDGPFERYVLYLVPSPGGSAPHEPGKPAEPEPQPGLTDAVLATFAIRRRPTSAATSRISNACWARPTPRGPTPRCCSTDAPATATRRCASSRPRRCSYPRRPAPARPAVSGTP
ncbi:patatin-like phospholipase family protein [Flindersiella endophytica]